MLLLNNKYQEPYRSSDIHQNLPSCIFEILSGQFHLLLRHAIMAGRGNLGIKRGTKSLEPITNTTTNKF